MDELDAGLQDQLVLTDLVNRVLDRGVTVVGDVIISVAGVDLVHLGLRLDLASVETARSRTVSGRIADALRSPPGPPDRSDG